MPTEQIQSSLPEEPDLNAIRAQVHEASQPGAQYPPEPPAEPRFKYTDRRHGQLSIEEIRAAVERARNQASDPDQRHE
jgi:hypothetical protein